MIQDSEVKNFSMSIYATTNFEGSNPRVSFYDSFRSHLAETCPLPTDLEYIRGQPHLLSSTIFTMASLGQSHKYPDPPPRAGLRRPHDPGSKPTASPDRRNPGTLYDGVLDARQLVPAGIWAFPLPYKNHLNNMSITNQLLEWFLYICCTLDSLQNERRLIMHNSALMVPIATCGSSSPPPPPMISTRYNSTKSFVWLLLVFTCYESGSKYKR